MCVVMKQASLFDFSERQAKLLKTREFLERINGLVDWEAFRDVLDTALARKDGGKGGQPSYDAILMFKVLVLQAFEHPLTPIAIDSCAVAIVTGRCAARVGPPHFTEHLMGGLFREIAKIEQ
jgi:hypothetical protein